MFTQQPSTAQKLKNEVKELDMESQAQWPRLWSSLQDFRAELSPCTPPLEPVLCAVVRMLEPEPARSRHRSRSRFRRPEELPPSTAAAGAAVPAIAGCRP